MGGRGGAEKEGREREREREERERERQTDRQTDRQTEDRRTDGYVALTVFSTLSDGAVHWCGACTVYSRITPAYGRGGGC